MEQSLEVVVVLRDAVGHGPLEKGPNELVRVKLGSIAREAMEHPVGVGVTELADRLSLVLASTVPEDDDLASQVLGKLAQEAGGLHGADVFILEESGIERQALSFRGDGDGRACRDLGPMSRATQDRRLSAGSPGAPNGGNEQEAALVEKDQVGPKLPGLFLYAAKRTASSARWPSRRAPGRALSASERSSPGPEEGATYDWHGSGCRDDLRSRGLRASASRGLSSSRSSWRLPKGFWSTAAADDHSVLMGAQGPVGTSAPWDRLCEQPPAIEIRSSQNCPPWRRLRIGSGPASADRWHATGASPAFLGFHLVAFKQASILSIAYA